MRYSADLPNFIPSTMIGGFEIREVGIISIFHTFSPFPDRFVGYYTAKRGRYSNRQVLTTFEFDTKAGVQRIITNGEKFCHYEIPWPQSHTILLDKEKKWCPNRFQLFKGGTPLHQQIQIRITPEILKQAVFG